ncbi:histidine decarboxylase [Dactylosporangium darangshiense]|uniref:Histidine decarboxylase n=1 Tax=Dactylosporangium darangshiense TaxID=579108 RepID=A0ABP8DMY0_9ACTN
MTALNTTADPLALAALDKLAADLRYHATNNIGFPDATDLDVRPLLPLLGTLLNNVGAPFGPAGPYRGHSKRFELAVVQQTADLFRAPWDDRWGYVTSGATEGTHCALWQARTRFPDALLVASTAAHYGVARVADMLRMPLLTVPTDDRDEIDYAALTDLVRRYRLPRRRRVPVVVVASVGTTMTEAVDDVRKVHAALDTAGVPRDARWVHADAALAGVPLGLLDPGARPGFDFADGATSIVVSGHKFLGVPMPCAVLVVLDSARPAGHDRLVSYTGSLDETVTGSRSGHAPLMLWWAWQVWGLDGLRQRATRTRALAAATTARLDAIGWPAWRHPLAFTVVLDRPPRTVLDQWPLGVDGNRAHLVCMPGKTTTMLDAFVADLHHVVTGQAGPGTADAGRLRTAVPGPRTEHLAGPALAPYESAEPC